MTEYELADAVASYASGGGTFFTIWLTILSAYAITAYVAGRDLSTFQVTWLNGLYLFTAILAIFAFHGQFNVQVFYVQEIKSLRPDSPQVMSSTILYSVTSVAAIGTLVTLAFMWQVRHPKTE